MQVSYLKYCETIFQTDSIYRAHASTNTIEIWRICIISLVEWMVNEKEKIAHASSQKFRKWLNMASHLNDLFRKL